MRRLFFVSFLLISQIGFTQISKESSLEFDRFIKQAKTNNQNLFLLFGHEQCSWCRVFDRFLDDQDVDEVLSKEFLILHLDMLKTDLGFELFLKYGRTGTPSWCIMDSNKLVLFDCELEGKNIGYPSSVKQIEYFLSCLRMTSKGISDQDFDLLHKKLLEHNPKMQRD